MPTDLKNLFTQPYQRDQYLRALIQQGLNVKPYPTPHRVDIEHRAIESFVQLGMLTLPGDKKLPLFELHINPDQTQLARNRVGLRNLVANNILPTVDGALAVYIDTAHDTWRLSFIAVEYLYKDGQATDQQTASRRYTYLLGQDTQTRTAAERLSQLKETSTLDDFKAAFAVETLNKEFYTKLHHWYEHAQTQVEFPNDANQPDHSHKQTSLIRLLTRLLFIWFIKQKGLIHPDLFDHARLHHIIDYTQPSSYYKAILQNLFFATLNHPIKDRGFCTRNSHFVTNLYRYQQDSATPLFTIDNAAILDLFKQTPFLNGGLFECLDHILDPTEKAAHPNRQQNTGLRLDGFSSHPKNPLRVPNTLFFNPDETQPGLINLLSQYQFTIEESTPLDIEVALDPELLGKVFENLLAAYNPETQKAATDRKTTGSYYTPRAIVTYMVDQSLKAYLAAAVPPADNDHTFYQERLQDLIDAADNTGQLTQANGTALIYPDEIPPLIQAISRINILDPAVGSGAFPMGILQRLVTLLTLLDPDNKQWQEQQTRDLPGLQSIQDDLKTTEQLSDTDAKRQAQTILEQKLAELKANFARQDHNYARKLYLIENCIYGVDIQPIAVQICKLRFFISLTIAQTPNQDPNDNYGIRALPNLETQFITANTLLPLGDIPRQDSVFDTHLTTLQHQLQHTRHQYFNAKTLQGKTKHRNTDKHLREQMLTALRQSGVSPEVQARMQKVVEWNLYDQNASADWFDPEWQFGIRDGFDIVLGNPPYVRQERIQALKPQLKDDYTVFTGTADIYTYFYEKGVNLLHDNGHLCLITSNKWMRAKYGEKLRAFFKTNAGLKQIIDFEGKQIFDATVDTNILLCTKHATSTDLHYAKDLPTGKTPLFTMPIDDLSTNAYTLQAPEILALKKKIEAKGTPLKDWDVNIQFGIKTGYNEAFIIDSAKRDELIAADSKSAEIIKPILRGRDIKRYHAEWAGLYLINSHNGDEKNSPIDIATYPAVKKHLDRHYSQLEKRQDKGITPYNLRSCAYLAEFAKEKITWQRVTKESTFCIVNPDMFIQDSMAFITADENPAYLTAILNSTLMKFLVELFVHKYGDTGYLLSNQYVEQLPIPQVSTTEQQPFVDRVDKILAAKQQGDDTTDLEADIDKLVYSLYNLTPDEIKQVKNHA